MSQTRRTTPFYPPANEDYKPFPITIRELKIIETMRRSAFGEFTIYKIGGKLIRIEPKQSIILNEEPDQKVE